MLTLRRSDTRGQADFGWLKSAHSFSFGEYYDPQFMGFGALRVINEDHVAPGAGFGTHPHKDMEIISYVLDGNLAHKDSTGGGSTIGPGTVQRMSAGTGIQHSEYNGSDSDQVHFLQIWLLPERAGLTPSYEEKVFDLAAHANNLVLLAANDPGNAALKVHQDDNLFGAQLDAGNEITFTPEPNRKVWLQLAKGAVHVNGMVMTAGDGLAVKGEAKLTIAANDNAEFLLFDLA